MSELTDMPSGGSELPAERGRVRVDGDHIRRSLDHVRRLREQREVAPPRPLTGEEKALLSMATARKVILGPERAFPGLAQQVGRPPEPTMEDRLQREIEELDVEAAWSDLCAEAEEMPILRPLLERVSPDELGPLEPDGVLWWFPWTDPSTGAKLSRADRRRWFMGLVDDGLNAPNPSGYPSWRDLPPAEANRKRQSELLGFLLYLKYAADERLLPPPEPMDVPASGSSTDPPPG